MQTQPPSCCFPMPCLFLPRHKQLTWLKSKPLFPFLPAWRHCCHCCHCSHHLHCCHCPPTPSDRPVRLWDEDLVLSEAQEVLLWHEALPGQLLEGEGLLERRLLEYCCLGDFATAVACLLSTPPESSVRCVWGGGRGQVSRRVSLLVCTGGSPLRLTLTPSCCKARTLPTAKGCHSLAGGQPKRWRLQGND